jgi:hypothetical protein
MEKKYFGLEGQDFKVMVFRLAKNNSLKSFVCFTSLNREDVLKNTAVILNSRRERLVLALTRKKRGPSVDFTRQVRKKWRFQLFHRFR